MMAVIVTCAWGCQTKRMKAFDDKLASPPSVGLQSTIARAHLLMKEYEHGHLPVMSGPHLVGVISREDVKRAISMHAKVGPEALLPRSELLVKNFMCSPVKEVSGKQGLAGLLKVFLDEGVAAVVLSDGQENAILTREDVLKIFDYLVENRQIDLDRALREIGVGEEAHSLAKFISSK
jgi:CBS domain-containing protein